MRDGHVKNGYIIGAGINNDIFNYNGAGNRDNCLLPFIALRKSLEVSGLMLNTYDLCETEPDFIILMNRCFDTSKFKCPIFLLLMESEFIMPANHLLASISEAEKKYSAIFSWDCRYSQAKNFVRLNYGNPIEEQLLLYSDSALGGQRKKKLCCIISGNKAVACEPTEPFLDLYKERVKVIKWFETNHISDFSLYGQGWNLPVPKLGSKFYNKYIRRILSFFSALVGHEIFPSYSGPVHSKVETLAKYKFSFCFENIYGLNGYITEKIFDCLMAGCVPVYYGAPDITNYIPEDAFINYANFESVDDVYNFMSTMSDSVYSSYLEAGKKFLISDAAFPFTTECFSSTIAEKIKITLGVLSCENK